MAQDNKIISFKISEKIYPLEILFLACYAFIDKVYIYIDQTKVGEFEVVMNAKEGTGDDKMKEISGEFHNELLFSALRQKISKNNKRLREAIVFSALFSAQGNNPETLMDNGMSNVIEDENINDDAWKDDPLGIAISWEEKKDAENKVIKPLAKVRKNNTSKVKKIK